VTASAATPRPERIVGLDLGQARIGVAVSGPGGVAVPHSAVTRSGDADADRAALAGLVLELGAARVVVGLPLSLDGTEGPAARAARAEAETLAALLEVPVDLVDERFTTVAAGRSLRAAGVSGRNRRQVVDQVAAAVLLQSWLDRHALRESP
jgi:putative Holliday junction resolvase